MFKTKSRLSSAEIIQQKLHIGHQILPFPEIVGRLLTALKKPDVSSAALAKIIEADPALSVRLLKMANSPVYGNTIEVQSVVRATTILGFGPLKRMALTFAASSLFIGGSDAKQNREMVWNHSLGCATVARQLAKFVQSINPDDAFLAGIFHDVGKLFFYEAIPGEYSELDSSFNGEQLIEREAELFDTTHEAVGVKLVTGWRLAEQLMVAVGFHHRPNQAIAHQDMAFMINVADSLAKQAGIGSRVDADIDISQESLEHLKLNEDSIVILKEQARQEFIDTKRAYAG